MIQSSKPSVVIPRFFESISRAAICFASLSSLLASYLSFKVFEKPSAALTSGGQGGVVGGGSKAPVSSGGPGTASSVKKPASTVKTSSGLASFLPNAQTAAERKAVGKLVCHYLVSV